MKQPINETGIIQQLEVRDINTEEVIGFGHFEWNSYGEIRQYLNRFDGEPLAEGFYSIRILDGGKLCILNRTRH